MKKLHFLVVEDNKDLAEIISETIEKEFSIDVSVFYSVNQAKEEWGNKRFDLIISDYKLVGGTGADIYTLMIEKQDKVPFVICSALPDDDYSFLGSKDISALILKPNIQQPLIEFIGRYLRQSQQEISEPEVTSGSLTKPGYAEVSIYALLQMGRLICDVYYQVNRNKYLKLAHENDEFTEEDYSRYVTKDIATLFIKKSEMGKFLSEFSKSIELSARENLELAIEVSGEGLKAIKLLARTLGWTSEIVKIAKTNIAVISSYLEKKSASLPRKIAELVRDSAKEKSSNSVLISYIASGIVYQLDWTNSSTHYKLALAAFLHDIVLTEEDFSKMEQLNQKMTELSSAEIKKSKYGSHPILAAKIAEEEFEASFDVCQVIRQHHEKVDGTGFPDRIGHQTISPLSAIFIIAEDLANSLLTEASSAALESFFETRKIIYSSSYFGKAFHTLESSFV